MKKLFSVILIIAAAMSLSSCSYNSMVKMDENVKTKWAAVQSQYQRRSDLIPNLVNTVKGAANFEKGTLTAVVEARAKATSVQVDPTKLTPESIKAFQAAQGELSTALGRLLSVTENYPNLKTNENFLGLQAQIEGTENRIQVARQDFNASVQEFNTKIRSFPANITAKMFGFSEKGYFTAEPGADKAPKVQF
ncbi:LemA protein [Mucilaginibacter lappiensis]|jgi:LemA protein|uniref:LemA protein n=1 Tax=Mucilaginibacter lappiensis TaxID=354630 RepID=A0ABR6PKA4_9SPHI|nr:LemA family protein [Mucilaginibacter lappiensis]MBB6110198.1 LemA protein [Mucilaginibacter lappiensis]SIR25814.1 LemA protein [Mucilaginibacter lappiensis]